MARYRNDEGRHASEGSQRGLSSRASSSSLLSLSNVIQLRPLDDMKVEPSVIAVPGYCTPPVQNWGVKHELEKAAIPIDAVSRLHMYIYQPSYDIGDGFSWEAFLKTGSDLAEDLARLATKFPNRPIIFIAHSLGGVLLKKALLLAHQNLQDPRFKLVVDCLSGILFLGTPHASQSDEDTLLRHNQILFSCAKIAVQKQSSRLPRHDVFQLATLAATFEQIANIPVLSVFEYAGHRSGVHRFFGKKNKALVDEQLATISSNAERLLGMHLNHSELCKLPILKDQKYSARDFLRSLFQDIAVNKKWTTEAASMSASQSPMLDPLNPLNLAPVEPLEREDVKEPHSSSKGKGKALARKDSYQTSLRLPLRLHLISNTSTDRLLDTRKAQLPCFMLPQYPNPDFVGRKDAFEAMDKHLLPRKVPSSGATQSTRLFALCGMGGIGKTDLAVEYAFSRRDHFQAIFWLEAGGVSQLASDFGRITTHLGLESADEAKDLESSIEIAKAWLTKPRSDSDGENESWLLIFDNADNLDVITDYIPYNGNGSVLVTSRDPFAKEHFFSNGTGIDLEPLSTAESAGLLRKLAKTNEDGQNQDEEDASMTLANQLDGLPLAMTQMAGFIRRRRISIREFVDLYATDAQYAKIHNVAHPVQEHRYGYTLATTFNFEGMGPDATRLVQLISFMNPDRIREDIFVNPQPVNKRNADTWTASTFEDARYELLTSSIIKRNINKKELWIHRVVQAEVRTRIDEGRRYHTFQAAVRLMAEIWPPGDLCSQASQRWKLCEDLLPHLERFYQLYIEYSESWDQFHMDPTFPTLLNEAAVYLHERGFSHEGKPYLKLALDLCSKANITQEPLVSDMHLTMGALSNETNDAQSCLEHNILCLAIRKDEASKTKQPDLRLAFAHSQMGIAYMMVGKYALATEYFKQSVELLKSIEVDPDEFGFPVCNLGLAYWIQGELEQADKTLTDLLLQREGLHGKLDKVSYKTGRVLQALGNVRASRAMRAESAGNHEDARKLWDESFALHQDCLQQYESTLGKFNHRTADACHKLAEHYIRRKKHVLAQDYLDRALSIWGDRQWFKNESARSSFLRGTHLLSMGGKANVEKGNLWIERAKLLRKEILPDEEPRQLETVDFDDLVCFWSI
ncbi:tetratricopeptide repeat domain-containing protein [Hypoxylon sp. FL1857]|nr:tetratricopeptide repeat domain-containing protein [Hypoxylon sp. FL1857]